MQHHPLWAKNNHDFDHIVNNYMPLLMEYKVDFYLNGHEHTMEYANYPYSQTQFDTKDSKPHSSEQDPMLQEYLCENDVEMHFGFAQRSQVFTKGDAIHQFTSGQSGREGDSLCAQ